MSPPSKKKRKKNTSKAIPNLEAALKAIGTVATKIESTHQSKADIAKELTKGTKELDTEVARLRKTDRSLKIYKQ